MNNHINQLPDIQPDEIDYLYQKLNREAEASGYHLNPDLEFAKELIQGLLINQKRFGYPACPCRLASGKKAEDLDIICPCDYRDPDLHEYSTCFCSLYVSKKVLKGQPISGSIPERRPERSKSSMQESRINHNPLSNLQIPVWRCKVCGYLCARENPPEVCPICKAEKERFERFL
jgi:ferredoxin-thioredoxin reductase catalytic subunit